MALIHANGHGVPVSFPIGDEGFCIVTAFRLSLRFQFQEESMQIDQEVFDDASGELTHTIGHLSYMNDGVRFWRLPPGRFRLYGLSDSLLVGSTEILTPKQSSTSTHNTPLLRTVKIEPILEPIHLLSDDSDDDTTAPKHLDSHPVFQLSPSLLSHPSQSPWASTGKPPLPQRPSDSLSVIDYLKKLSARKGSKSVVTKIDYSSIRLEKVEVLPSTFDGDVVFELPPIGASSSHSQARLLRGMDKRYDGHAWTRTITSNIKNDMGLTFRSSSCLGHLKCINVNCDYVSRVHRTSIANEVEWDGVSSSSL
jgi:hypothetical protein